MGTGCTQTYSQQKEKIDMVRQRQRSLTKQGVGTEVQFLGTEVLNWATTSEGLDQKGIERVIKNFNNRHRMEG